MLKVKVLSTILVLTMSIGVLVGCGSKQSGDDKQTSGTLKLKDGTYKVEYAEYDAHDYKGQLELTVSGGKITAVVYDEVKKDGSLKSKDEAYKKSMEEGGKTYPEKAYNELEDQLISKQTANVDGVSGATASSKNFKALVKYALEKMAAKGDTTPAKISAK